MQTKIKTESANITIAEDFAGQRVDNFLFNKLKNIPKTRIYKMVRKGEVRVNKRRVSAFYKLQADDVLRLPPFWSDATEAPRRPTDKVVHSLDDKIIYEDDALLIINKPSGMASHGGSGISFGVIETLRHARPEIKNLELVHRLDRDTSGCLVLAKKRSALRALHELIRNGAITKQYVLLVKGKWQGDERKVDLPLLKNQLSSGERIVRVNSEGKDSITIFRPREVYADSSLIEAELRTGRTHQIRVHAAHIGHPIAGDEKYGDKEFNQEMKSRGLKRLFLHAERIAFTLPNGRKIDIKAKLDDVFSS